MVTSTRRFLVRPSGVALLATGTSGPRPSISMRSGCVIPFLITLATASARSFESTWFDGKRTVLIGVESVWPITFTLPGVSLRNRAMSAATGVNPAFTSA